MTPGIIVSMEQALSLTYATMRFVHLGWRVIKVEATPQSPGALPGDPNRYIGSVVADEGRRSYFVGPNVGKQSVALNLKTAEGRALLHRMIRELKADVFCCNTLPTRYRELGIDYDTLANVKPDLIWAAISAMGPEHPNAAGYDPALQAMAGYMEVTGQRDGPPTLSGIPLVDLKAGDEVFSHVWMGLAERATSGHGSRIDVSMLQAAASWLITLLPLVDFECDPSEITRAGNEHRKYVPTNAFPTRDGAVLLAIGSDVMWRRLVSIPRLAALAEPEHATNEGRIRHRDAINAAIVAATRPATTAELVAELAEAKIPHAPINTVEQAMQLEAVASRLTSTTLPSGRAVRLQPMAVDYPGAERSFPFPPRYGEQTAEVLAEIGIDAGELGRLKTAGIVAGPETVEDAARRRSAPRPASKS